MDLYHKLIKASNQNNMKGKLDNFGLRDDHELAYLWQTFFNLQKIEEEEEQEQRLHKSKKTKRSKGKAYKKGRRSSVISHRRRDVETSDKMEKADPYA